jgi:hypothetical protein
MGDVENWKFLILPGLEIRSRSRPACSEATECASTAQEELGKFKKIITSSAVSNETVMYGYESSAALTTDRLQYKLQTRPLVREDASKQRAKQFSGKRKEKAKSGHRPQRVPETKTY